MNFTREPTIETIISPKEGYKLLVRSSRGGNQEEYFVDAIEVVCFGRAFFFRCLEHPKAFLLPVSDYELLEVKEARVALKTASHERNIKIGGGREAPLRRAPESDSDEGDSQEAQEQPLDQPHGGRKRDRRRRHRGRGRGEGDWQPQQERTPHEPRPAPEPIAPSDLTQSSAAMFSTLFPPPPTLISETISRYKDKEFYEGDPLAKEKKKEEEDEEESSGGETTTLQRVTAEFTSLPVPDPFF